MNKELEVLLGYEKKGLHQHFGALDSQITYF